MSQQVQQNKGQATGRTVVPPKPTPDPKAVAATTKVDRREIRWPEVRGFHGKQHSESQDDSFGTQMRRIAIVDEKGQEIALLQKDGKHIDGIVPTFQRQLLKLGLVVWFTNPSAIKARGYHRTVAMYGKEMANVLGSLSTKRYHLECTHGTKGTRLSADPEVLGTFLTSVVALERATAARWPSEEPGEEPSPDQEITEEVSLNLLG